MPSRRVIHQRLVDRESQVPGTESPPFNRTCPATGGGCGAATLKTLSDRRVSYIETAMPIHRASGFRQVHCRGMLFSIVSLDPVTE